MFGSRKYQTEKKELLIAITPHVIKSQAQADELTREFMNKVKSLKAMLETREEISKRFEPSEETDDESM